MIPFPLTRVNRLRLARAFAEVPRVDISIECAIEDQMGSAYVDSLENPTLFMIEQDGFFCYFGGDMSGDKARDFISKMPEGRMIMAGSQGWHEALKDAFGERAREIKRWNHSSDTLTIEHLKELAVDNPHTSQVQRVDVRLASMETPYLELGAFDSPEDFVERGIGYCLLKDDVIIGGAYSSLVCSNAIEVSIVVNPTYHRQGIATALACQLLIWCLEHQLSPHWDAANDPSCNLADKLAYSGKQEYKAYYFK